MSAFLSFHYLDFKTIRIVAQNGCIRKFRGFHSKAELSTTNRLSGTRLVQKEVRTTNKTTDLSLRVKAIGIGYRIVY